MAASTPRSASRRSSAAPSPRPSASPEEIARRAYEHFVARGREHGHDLDDWLTAERELTAQAAAATAADRR